MRFALCSWTKLLICVLPNNPIRKIVSHKLVKASPLVSLILGQFRSTHSIKAWEFLLEPGSDPDSLWLQTLQWQPLTSAWHAWSFPRVLVPAWSYTLIISKDTPVPEMGILPLSLCMYCSLCLSCTLDLSRSNWNITPSVRQPQSSFFAPRCDQYSKRVHCPRTHYILCYRISEGDLSSPLDSEPISCSSWT